MKRKIVEVCWEDEDFQDCFAQWVPFPDARASAEDVDRIETLLDLSPPMDVLDVGCGNGRHALEFARRGYRVVGIDVAERFLARAREAAQNLELDVGFRHQRACELRDKNAFDVALAYWHTIGFMSEDEISRHFICIREALKSTCPLLYVFQGPRRVPGQEAVGVRPTRNWSEKDGKFILSEKQFQNGYRDELGVVIDTNTGVITEYREHQRAIGFREILGILRDAGFASIDAYSDFDKTAACEQNFSVFVCRNQALSDARHDD